MRNLNRREFLALGALGLEAVKAFTSTKPALAGQSVLDVDDPNIQKARSAVSAADSRYFTFRDASHDDYVKRAQQDIGSMVGPARALGYEEVKLLGTDLTVGADAHDLKTPSGRVFGEALVRARLDQRILAAYRGYDGRDEANLTRKTQAIRGVSARIQFGDDERPFRPGGIDWNTLDNALTTLDKYKIPYPRNWLGGSLSEPLLSSWAPYADAMILHPRANIDMMTSLGWYFLNSKPGFASNFGKAIDKLDDQVIKRPNGWTDDRLTRGFGSLHPYPEPQENTFVAAFSFFMRKGIQLQNLARYHEIGENTTESRFVNAIYEGIKDGLGFDIGMHGKERIPFTTEPGKIYRVEEYGATEETGVYLKDEPTPKMDKALEWPTVFEGDVVRVVGSPELVDYFYADPPVRSALFFVEVQKGTGDTKSNFTPSGERGFMPEQYLKLF